MNNNNYIKLLLQESYEVMIQELKVLFLRTRNNSDALYWRLINDMYKHMSYAKMKGTFSKADVFFKTSIKSIKRSFKTI